MADKDIDSFNTFITKQFKTDRGLNIVILELVANENANLYRLFSMFNDRVLSNIPVQVFKGIAYQNNSNQYLRVAITMKPSLYTYINEKTRFSGNNYPSLITTLSNIWNKLLFDTKVFPKNVEANYRIISTDIINGVNLDSKETENIVKLISDKLLYNSQFLENYLAITKTISLNLLTRLELNEYTFAEGYNIFINENSDIDINEICKDLNEEVKNEEVGFIYCFNKNINSKVISVIIFNNKQSNFINLLIEIITRKDLIVKSKLHSEHFEFGEIDSLVDPREYNRVKLKAEEIFVSMLTKKEVKQFKEI